MKSEMEGGDIRNKKIGGGSAMLNDANCFNVLPSDIRTAQEGRASGARDGGERAAERSAVDTRIGVAHI